MNKIYPFSKVVEGFLLSLRARHLSQNTIDDYGRTLAKFSKFLRDDMPVDELTSWHVEKFMESQTGLSNKTLLNYFIGLSACWTWLVNENIVPENITRKLTKPKPEQREIIPLTETEIRLVMAALNRSKVYSRDGNSVDHALGTAERNRAIILLLLDTGLRASELCNLTIQDLDAKGNRVSIVLGKGAKDRTLPFSPRTGQAIWRYMASRKDTRPEDPLFATKSNGPMTRTKLTEALEIIGRRAGVTGVHSHRFRHTFAIEYLRRGGNAFALQTMLGHSSMETVKIYLKLSQVDLDVMMRRASPVDGWRL